MCMGIRPFTVWPFTGQATWGKPLAANCPSVGVQRVLWAPPQIHVLILTVLIFLGFMHAAADAVSSYVQWACPVRKTVPQQPLQLPAPQSTRDFYDLLFAFFLLKLTSWEWSAEELRGRRGSQNEALLPEQRHSVLCANKLMKLCFSSAVSMSVIFKIRHLFFKGKLKCLSVSRSRIQKASQAISSFNTEWDSVPEVCSGISWFHTAYFLVKTGAV